MVQWSNKYWLFFVLWLAIARPAFCQFEDKELNEKDYKDPNEFEKFYRRRHLIAAWQINQLRDSGALVVRLKTNKLLIDELNRSGKSELATQKQLEQFAINKNLMFAYLENFRFCKVYFIFSNSSDTLLNGARKGMFLDTNLTVDPAIIMSEKFYLIAERDYAYNSSIGFVREDSARVVKESGNPVKEMAIVVKNKYGHQLKQPFPYYIKEKNFMDAGYNFPIKYEQKEGEPLNIMFAVDRQYLERLKNRPGQPEYRTVTKNNITSTNVKIKKQFTYEKLSLEVTELNDNFISFYKSSPRPDFNRVKTDIRPFLY